MTIAIIGRPNVGKSTLFNRLVGKRLALVDDTPGVTRDRRAGTGRIGPLEFQIIDTAGLEEGGDDSLSSRMRQQTDAAIDAADIILFMIDARAGITPLDSYFADVVRKRSKPTICVANKCEGKAATSGLYEAYTLGLGDPIPLSSEHGDGFVDLHDAIVAAAAENGFELDEEISDEHEVAPLQMAIIGRPNVGKSTLVNRLLGEDRQVTGPEAGITRDSIGLDWHWGEREIKLFDTAGLRRRARVQEKLEKLSVADTLRAIQYAEVVVLVIDGTIGFEKQDHTIADLVAEEGRALVIAVNKTDAITDMPAAIKSVRDSLERSLHQVRGVPVVPLSALSGRGIDKLMPAVLKVHETWNKRVSTAAINRWLEDVIARNPPPSDKGRRVKIRFGSQVKTRPPTFIFFVNRPDAIPQSYLRYLSNDLRESFDMMAVPLRLLMRKSDNPFAEKK
nr:ribosome biogenesis GTPase Der [Govania unica]